MNALDYNPNLLKAARKKKLTQEQLAKRLGVTEMTIYRAENGKSVSYQLLSKICSEIGLDVKKVLVTQAV